ncbi:hypothetical protein ABIG06_005989 [Bradyrhizobium sp. USDA 326]
MKDVHIVTDGKLRERRRRNLQAHVADGNSRGLSAPLNETSGENIHIPDEGCNEAIRGTAIDITRRGNLTYPPRRHHRNTA